MCVCLLASLRPAGECFVHMETSILSLSFFPNLVVNNKLGVLRTLYFNSDCHGNVRKIMQNIIWNKSKKVILKPSWIKSSLSPILEQYLYLSSCEKNKHTIIIDRIRSGSVVKRLPRIREIRIRFAVVTELHVSRKNRWWQLHFQALGNRCECQWSSEMTIINGWPVSQ